MLIGLIYLVYTYYPALNIITGYASKNLASGLFLAGRDSISFEEDDNGFFPVNLSSYTIDLKNKSVTASIFGLMKRKAVFVEGRGAVLLNDRDQSPQDHDVPKRKIRNGLFSYPYGDLPQRDTIFEAVNYEMLERAVEDSFDDIGEKDKKTRSVLVVYKDHIISEKYVPGFDKNTVINGWSMTKSLTGTIYGVLAKKGLIDINDRTGIEEWAGDDRKHITIDNLLHMNSGLAWDEAYFNISDVTRMLYFDSDMGQSQIRNPLVGKPNELWNYASGTTNILSGPLMRKLFDNHQEYLDFWYTELIDKIGMHSAVVETDLKGNYIGSSYAWATTRDWAKLGLLYLHQGNWHGEQVLDSSWVQYVRTPTNTSEGRYGAQFWLNADGHFPDVPRNMFSCNGFQGQYIFIFPDLELVVVRTGLASEPSFDVNEFLKEILSSIQSD